MPGLAILLVLAATGIATFSTASKAEGTPEQRWACEKDAFKYCRSEIPNVTRVTICMTKNIKKLSPPCRAQFK